MILTVKGSKVMTPRFFLPSFVMPCQSHACGTDVFDHAVAHDVAGIQPVRMESLWHLS